MEEQQWQNMDTGAGSATAAGGDVNAGLGGANTANTGAGASSGDAGGAPAAASLGRGLGGSAGGLGASALGSAAGVSQPMGSGVGAAAGLGRGLGGGLGAAGGLGGGVGCNVGAAGGLGAHAGGLGPGCVHRGETERLRSRVQQLEREVCSLRRCSPWENSHCDGCGVRGNRVEGPRMRCTTCLDKDYCVSCLKRGRICRHTYVVVYGNATDGETLGCNNGGLGVPLGVRAADVVGRAM